MTRPGHVVHRFLVRSNDAGYAGVVDGGRLLEWIDKVAFDAAARWSGGYSVTAYVGNLHLDRPIDVGDLVELHAQMVYTGRSSMHILVTVYSCDPTRDLVLQSAQCLTVFVAVDDHGKARPVREWQPSTILEQQRSRQARARIALRRTIESDLAAVEYTTAGTAPTETLRFLAAPSDINWGGNVHGGRTMHWIDEACYVAGAKWTADTVIASYFGGIRFYQPIRIGQIVEVTARLIYTGSFSLHFAVHVTAASTDSDSYQLAAHAVAVFVGYGADGKHPVPGWTPRSGEDTTLWQHAQRLIELRAHAEPFMLQHRPPADVAPRHLGAKQAR